MHAIVHHLTRFKRLHSGHRQRQDRGFTLILTIALLVLITMVGVGMLSLSSTSLRASVRSEAMSMARANARMALILAIGELQKQAGVDQRVTARADIIEAKVARPRLTGVWQSWEMDANAPPTPSDYEKPARDGKFLGWLTSSADPAAVANVDFVRAEPMEPVKLWSQGSLGTDVAKEDIVEANKVATTTKSRGAFAWAVLDEGVKARINTDYDDKADTKAQQIAQLGAGVRPNASSITGLEGLMREFYVTDSSSYTSLQKGVTRKNFQLASESLASGTDAQLKKLTHDITTDAAGVLANVAAGGLREDFHLLTNASSLPSKFAKTGVYQSLLGYAKSASVAYPNDPRWKSLWDYARLYRDSDRLFYEADVPKLLAKGPENWKAVDGSNPLTGDPGVVLPDAPEGLVMLPTIAKVQLVFSILTRDIYNYPKVSDTAPKPPQSEAEENNAQLHGPWGKNFAGSSYDYLLHLLYTPVVTVHNPYNVALKFDELKIVFGNVPFGLQVIRNGIAQTNGFAPLDTMYYQTAEKGELNKRFGMTLKTNGGTMQAPSVGQPTFTLLPGEVMMFSPYIDPNRSWQQEYSGKRVFADWDNDKTRAFNIDGIPGWRGDGIGFDLDWFCPSYNGLRVSSNEVENGRSMSRGGCIGARAEDEFVLKFAPLSVPDLSKNKFTVELFAKPAKVGNSNPADLISSGVIEMDYESPTGLQNSLLGAGGVITFPKNGSINALAMHSHATTPIRDISTVKPFAIVSAQAKMTMGGMLADGEDGKLATKPWSFAHPVIGASKQRILSENSANHSHEFAFQALENGTINLLQFDPKTGRGNFITGQTGNTGVKFGAIYDVPLGPLQSFSTLNGANPGGCSGYLPRFAQPIGNSWAHPLLKSTQMVTSHSSGPLLDHSFMLNMALYDRFYFSGLADQSGRFGNGKTSSALAEEFLQGKHLSDPRLQFYVPRGKTSSQFTAQVAATEGYRQVAAWQMMRGAFNVNSTSVAAWKAMLASIHDDKALKNQLNKGNSSSALAALQPVDVAKNEARISRFRLPVSDSEEDGGDPKESYWLGAMEYSDAQLQTLAEKIVEQVRLRGPFLSMAEFVNRRLGSSDLAQSGALQRAIDLAQINEALSASSSAGYDIPENALTDYKYENVKAGAGLSSQGAPGYLSQADLLTVLGNAATARSDTFTIRAYGEARDGDNQKLASVVCEAVVQRVPDFLDPADQAATAIDDLLSPTNKAFGRALRLISFRWLAPEEI